MQYWQIPEQRMIKLGGKTSMLGISTPISKYVTLPPKTPSEHLDYAVDISELLIKSNDRILQLQATKTGIDFNWISFYKSLILLGITGGTAEQKANIFLNIITTSARQYTLILTMSILEGPVFNCIQPVHSTPPNWVVFPNTKPLRDTRNTIFSFG